MSNVILCSICGHATNNPMYSNYTIENGTVDEVVIYCPLCLGPLIIHLAGRLNKVEQIVKQLLEVLEIKIK